MQVDAIPQIVKDKVRFCCWRYETRKGQQTKVPYNPVSKRRAETDRPETFSDFATAVAAAKDFDGLGFLVGNQICAIDLDDCFAEDDSLNSLASVLVAVFNGSYMERSPSGKGLRIIFMADGFVYDKAKYYINNRKIGMEVYVAGATNRFVTVTGNVYRQGDVLEQSEALQGILDKYMIRPDIKPISSVVTGGQSYLSDESVIEKALKTPRGQKFQKLWQGDTSDYASDDRDQLAECGARSYREEAIKHTFMVMLQEMKSELDVVITDAKKQISSVDLDNWEKDRLIFLEAEIERHKEFMRQLSISTDSEMSEDIYHEMNDNLQHEIDTLISELDLLLEKQQEVLTAQENFDWFIQALDTLSDFDSDSERPEFREDIFNRIVARGDVFDDGSIQYELNIGLTRKAINTNRHIWKKKALTQK